MDPRLRLLIESGEEPDEVAVLVRLAAAPAGQPLPEGVRVVARFGDVATVRLPRGSLTGMRDSDAVASVKAPWRIAPEPLPSEPLPSEPLPSEAETGPSRWGTGSLRRERELRGVGGLPLTGRGVVVGVVDWGLDVTHPAFRHPDGSTRVLALWDQQPAQDPAHPNRYGYGRVHDQAAIDRALHTPDPAAQLGYHAELSDLGSGAHGTATTSIAAGSDWAGGIPGVAPEADIVFVHLSTWGPDGPQRLGDSVALAEALDFVRACADGRPFVINASLGGCCGAHDGTSLLERAMDHLVTERAGQAIAQSCGNYLGAGKHASGRLRSGEEVRLPMEVPAGSRVPHELDLWYAGPDRLSVTVTGPGGSPRAHVPPGRSAVLSEDGLEVGRLLHRLHDPNDGRNEVLMHLDPSAASGIWELTLVGLDVRDGRYDAWIERDSVPPSGQAHFPRDVAVTSTTTGTICNGLQTLVVGAYDHRADDGSLAAFSSRGPTVDGRPKPDLVAPGSHTLVARSRPAGAAAGAEVPLATVMSGTSMAAPHVTGTIACLFQSAALPAAAVRSAVLTTCRPYVGDEPQRAGHGYLDPAAAIAAVMDGARHRPRASRGGDPVSQRTQEAEEAQEAQEMRRQAMHELKESAMSQVQPVPDDSLDAAGRAPTARRAEGVLRRPAELLDELHTSARDLVAAFVADTDPAGRSVLGTQLDLLSGPGDLLDPELRPGDLLVRGAPGEGHACAMTLLDGRVLSLDRATRAGWDLEASVPGQYALVLEDGRRVRTAEDRWARRVADERSIVPRGQAVLRPTGQPGGGPETHAEDVPTPLRSALLANDDELAAVAAGRVRLGAVGTAPYPAPVTSGGEAVRKVQQALVTLRYPVGRSGADGRFGGDTGRAVSRFKTERGITPSDPVVGPATIRCLDDELVARQPPQPTGPPSPLPPTPLPPTPLPAPLRPRPDQGILRWVNALGPRLRPGNQATGLIDGPETFAAILRAIRTATGPDHFVYLLGWWLDLDVALDPGAQPASCARLPLPAVTASTLRTLLRAADASGVQVRAMLWDQTGSSQNTAEVGWVNALPHGAAMLDNNQLSSWVGSQHQKLVVVGGSEGLVAFCGGIDVNPDRVCPTFPPGTPLLPATSMGPAPRSQPSGQGTEAWEELRVPRVASGVVPESSSGSSGGGDPLHDVHVRLTGPAADDLLQVFVGRWYANPEHRRLDQRKGALRGLCQPPSRVSGAALVRVEQTFNATFAPPARPVTSCASPPPQGPVLRVRERGIQQIYLTAIEHARRFIYWEDQYMVSMCAAEALRRALPHVELVILLMADSLISDLPHRWAWRKRFVEHIRRDPQGHKLRVFTLRDAATGGIGPHTYVHAKTMMVDDELSIIGSANCNRRGWESDTEVAAAIVGDADPSGRLFAGRIRQRLWAEHLGVSPSVVEDPLASAPLWWLPAALPGRRVTLPSGAVVAVPGRRVLPYDVDGDVDSIRDALIPDDVVDPPAPLPGSPCGPGGALAVGVSTQPQAALAGAAVRSVRFSVG